MKKSNVTTQKQEVYAEKFQKTLFTIDNVTGKLEELGEAKLAVTPKITNKNFTMLWAEKINCKDDIKHNLQIGLLFFLIEHMKNNIFIGYDEDLARIFKCTRQRIASILKKYKKMNILKKREGVIFFNPGVIWRGSASKKVEAEFEYGRWK